MTYATGEVGKAFSFDGVNDWAALGDPSSLAFTASFTIEGWIKVNGLPTNYNFGSIMFRGDDRGGLDPYSARASSRTAVCNSEVNADHGRRPACRLPSRSDSSFTWPRRWTTRPGR